MTSPCFHLMLRREDILLICSVVQSFSKHYIHKVNTLVKNLDIKKNLSTYCGHKWWLIYTICSRLSKISDHKKSKPSNLNIRFPFSLTTVVFLLAYFYFSNYSQMQCMQKYMHMQVKTMSELKVTKYSQ